MSNRGALNLSIDAEVFDHRNFYRPSKISSHLSTLLFRPKNDDNGLKLKNGLNGLKLKKSLNGLKWKNGLKLNWVLKSIPESS